ncbi:MAG: hypothetical protein GDA54_01720 [Alphaproteobacteria bacterium GM7ARS4]|nr:hypothetical protein [Alphaproteobacteria bacterium GM7ARS4]
MPISDIAPPLPHLRANPLFAQKEQKKFNHDKEVFVSTKGDVVYQTTKRPGLLGRLMGKDVRVVYLKVANDTPVPERHVLNTDQSRQVLRSFFRDYLNARFAPSEKPAFASNNFLVAREGLLSRTYHSIKRRLTGNKQSVETFLKKHRRQEEQNPFFTDREPFSVKNSVLTNIDDRLRTDRSLTDTNLRQLATMSHNMSELASNTTPTSDV